MGPPLNARALISAVSCTLCACVSVLPTHGGGTIETPAGRSLRPSDIALTPGYSIEPVASGLSFPTGVTFDDRGRVYVVESGYSYGEVYLTPRLLRVEPGGAVTAISSGGHNGPWNGVSYHAGAFYVAEGGTDSGGRVLRIGADGVITALLEHLPTGGDHHTDGPVLGPDGKLYFGLGTMTNSGVVGTDNFELGWLKRHPDWHDVPCRELVLAGKNFESKNPLTGGDTTVSTGAFLPYGTPSEAEQHIPGEVPCSGAVLRADLESRELELVGWGFRNPFGLAFTPAGELLVTDNGYDVRGSRPVWGDADWLWTVDPKQPPLWHGWPDYADGRALDQERYKPPGQPQPARLLASEPNPAPKPLALFATHSSSNGIDVSRSAQFGFVGQAFVAQFGDQAPWAGKTVAPAGFKVVRVNLHDGVIEEFAANVGTVNGPASYLKSGGLERPIAVRFHPTEHALYVVDFGVMTMSDKAAKPLPGTGVLWRIRRTGKD
jgi:glucose/arabinose dehydrogenase